MQGLLKAAMAESGSVTVLMPATGLFGLFRVELFVFEL